MIRALRHLRDSAKPDRAEIERELAFFRKHRQRMRYHALKAEGVAIGSGVVEAANKTLVTQRMKRSGMRWRIASGQAVLTFRALIKSARFDVVDFFMEVAFLSLRIQHPEPTGSRRAIACAVTFSTAVGTSPAAKRTAISVPDETLRTHVSPSVPGSNKVSKKSFNSSDD